MGLFDFFSGKEVVSATSFAKGRCAECVYCRSMPMFTGNGMRDVFVCEMSQRADGCVRMVGPSESCGKFVRA